MCESRATGIFLDKLDDVGSAQRRRVYGKCSNCRLIFVFPECHVSFSEEKSRYDKHQNNLAQEGYVKFLEGLLDPLLLKLRPGARGLDFGCGPVPAIEMILKPRGFTVASYDPYYFPREDFLHGPFDFVIGSEVVEHFRFPRKAFLDLNGLLATQESYLAVMTSVLDREAGFEGWWYRRDLTHVCFYQKETFDWIAQWFGWSVEYPRENVIIYSKGNKYCVT